MPGERTHPHPPALITAQPRRLLGIRIQTSLAENRATELWRSFRPRISEIPNRLGADFFDVKCYGPEMTNGQFSPTTIFEKWAAVEVEAHADMPEGMQPIVLPGGRYAVFVHHGPASAFRQTYQYIFGTWLPTSGYLLDDRPHFDVMGPTYRPDDPEATEEIWVPVRERLSNRV